MGAAIWHGWKEMNDEEFLQSYGAGIEEFMSLCQKCVTKGESIILEHYERIEDLFSKAYAKMRGLYVQLASQGVDLAALDADIDRELAKTARKDEDGQEFFSAVVVNLRENSRIPRRSLRNIERCLRAAGLLSK